MHKRPTSLFAVAVLSLSCAAASAVPLTGDPLSDGWTYQGNTLQTTDPIYVRHTDGPGSSVFTPDRVADYDVYTRIFRLADEVAASPTFQANDLILGVGFVLNDVAADDQIAWSEGFFAVDFNNNSWPTAQPGSNYTAYADTALPFGDAGDVDGFVDANPNPGDVPAAFEVEGYRISLDEGDANVPYAPSSPLIPATVVVQTDVEEDIAGGRMGMTQGQILINYSAINRARGSFAGQQEGELGSEVTLRVAFLENYGAGADAAVTLTNPFDLESNGAFASGDLTGWEVTTGGGSATPFDKGDGDFGALLTTGSPVAISHLIDTPSDPFHLLFDYEFLSTTGQLDILLGGVLLDTLLAPAALLAGPSLYDILVVNPTLLGQNLELTFLFDGISQSQVVLDNIDVQSALEPVPEPATCVALLMGLGALGFTRRRRH